MAEAGRPATRVVLVTAWSGVGKTTTGDYLGQYCGFYHHDGDNIMHKPHVPECKQPTEDLVKAFREYWFLDKPCPKDIWQPYVDMLCDQITQLRASQDTPIVVTFSVYRREVRDHLRLHLGAGLEFLKLECDVDVVVQAGFERFADFAKTKGITMEQLWEEQQLDNEGIFNFDNYKSHYISKYLQGMEPFGDDEADYKITSTTARDQSVFDGINSALSLGPRTAEVDYDMLKAIQTERWKVLNKNTEKASTDAAL